ncbi:non-structural maintenance of chromosomes element 4 homolog A-like [Gastrolobium bilobum]|uniref:non-structural maintenance of chromosomes element 4 homolog A-like n=1 Tax=Gastrolobium bilobum TaxID=150636 RepID=UPI002AAF5E2F|nr:non-structural maintenance of chromosomes element 4 homolog A-like [Gastrolobium bilobum]
MRGSRRGKGVEQLRAVKKERLTKTADHGHGHGHGHDHDRDRDRDHDRDRDRDHDHDHDHNHEHEHEKQDHASRRVIRSQFLKLKTLINEKKDDLVTADSDNFDNILNEFDKLHEQVEKPREQVADAEALLDLTRTLVGSVRSLVNENVTPSQFVGSLLKHYAQDSSLNSINWKKLDLAVSPFFLKVHGCSTMLGPMQNELKQRKTGVHRKRDPFPTATARPEQLDDTGGEGKTDTDNNMLTMFGILRRMKRVRLESLILNRTSFAQTVENLFSLSFLVKDGRAEISLDENGSHYVSPKNAPAANSVMSKEVSYTHFVFRYDYQDWKLMKDMVPDGHELMPNRIQYCTVVDSKAEMGGDNSQPALAVTPIRKLSRNRGLIVQEEGVVEESPQCDEENAGRAAAIRRCKRKLH